MFRVETVGDDIDASMAALPPELMLDFAGLRFALELSPRTVGRGPRPDQPRRAACGNDRPGRHGQVVFHVLERDRVVAIVQVSFL